jgi:secreted trypsin-like serine protease
MFALLPAIYLVNGMIETPAVLAQGLSPETTLLYEKSFDIRLNPARTAEDGQLASSELPEQEDAFYEKSQNLQALVPTLDAEGEANSRVVNGVPAKPGAWPSTVNLEITTDGVNIGLCAGTIIDSKWVLTAAHCLFKLKDGGVRALRYVTAYEKSNILRKGLSLRAKAVYVHRQYDWNNFVNDIALVELEKPASVPRQKLTAGAGKPIFLVPGNIATIIGWGETKPREREAHPLSAQLLQATVPVVDHKTCADIYRRRPPPNLVTDTSFCAGYRQGGTDSCKGDSGGPIFVGGQGGEPVQAGIVSWGDGCARPDAYGVYTDVGHFESWIRQRAPNAQFVTARPAAQPTAPDQIAGATPDGPPAPHGQCSVDIFVAGATANRIKVKSQIIVRVTSGITGNLAVFNKNAAGKTAQIFPNKLSGGRQVGQAPTAVRAGQVIDIPGPADQFSLTISPPLGRNEIIALIVPPGVNLSDITKAFEDMSPIDNFEDVLATIATHTERQINVVPRAPRAFARRQFEVVP